MNSEGSAFVDRSGRVVAADAVFRALFDLFTADAKIDLGSSAEFGPSLRSFLAGEGPDRMLISRPEEEGAFLLSRVVTEEGVLLHARHTRWTTGRTYGEDAVVGMSLTRLARGFAHEIRSPLNAMSLQLALLADKLGEADRFVAEACANSFESLRSQIGRLNEMVRRYVDIADPDRRMPFDAGALLSEVAQSFTHEARRRGFVLRCEATPDTVRAAADPRRTAALLLGLFWGLFEGIGEGGRLIVRAIPDEVGAVLSLERHGRGLDRELARIESLATSVAEEMRGRLAREVDGGILRFTLTLPKEHAT